MNKKLLIIDDDYDILNIYSAFFRQKNFIVETALNTKNGIDLINSFMPDLIILDVMMNEPDEGFVFSQKLVDKKISIPVIITSSIAKAGMEIFDLDIPNVKSLIQKPVDLEDLLGLVNKYS